MATRALIGFIEDGVLTSTYNHYDGYPENLGKGLELYYSTPEEALKIASMGYISYLNLKTGEIEAKHKSPADKTELEDEFEEAMIQVAEVGDSYGADYIYIYNTFTNKWINVPLRQGINSAAKMLKNRLFEMAQDFLNFFDDEDEMNEDYNTKWKNFLNEEEKPQVKVKDDGTKNGLT